MANNRLFLIHRPRRIGIMIGRGGGEGLAFAACPKLEDKLNKFYEYLANESDDFVLAIETGKGPGCLVYGEWEYTEKQKGGFQLFKLKINE